VRCGNTRTGVRRRERQTKTKAGIGYGKLPTVTELRLGDESLRYRQSSGRERRRKFDKRLGSLVFSKPPEILSYSIVSDNCKMNGSLEETPSSDSKKRRRKVIEGKKGRHATRMGIG